MNEILDLTVSDIHLKLLQKEISIQEIVDFYTARISVYDSILNTCITTTFDRAQSDVDKIIRDQSFIHSDHLLAGIPATIKDAIVTRGIRSTGGSLMLTTYVPTYDATLVSRLSEAGMVLLGKTNCDEFAMGSSNENSSFGPVKNPWDISRVAGGSSGGPAAAVAAGLSHYSIGTDTGGSVREPASFCGVVGFKPTYGAISRYGLMAMSSSLDQAGVISRRVTDAAEVFRVIAGSDHLDATSRLSDTHLHPQIWHTHQSLKGIRVGVVQEFFSDGINPDVKKVVLSAIDQLSKLGADIVDVHIPHARYALPVYYIIQPAEVSSNMSRYDGIRYGSSLDKDIHRHLEQLYTDNRSSFLGEGVQRRILLGTYVLSSGYYDAYYTHAQKVRQLIVRDFTKAFESVDVIVGPVAPTTAPLLGEKTQDPLSMYLMDIYTVTVNLAGLPAISVPAGFAEGNQLPVGLHMIGKWWDDWRLLDCARLFEDATKVYREKPSIKL